MVVYAVIGPTASGKSAYAVSLAEKLDGEIISGDSMQIYRGMDVGTAKPTAEEMRGIPHHLIDVADITEAYSAVRFVADARKAISDVVSRGKTPIVCGGTGMYIDMLLTGAVPPETPEDRSLRAELYAYAEANGAQALHSRLASVDPEAAAAIHPNNVKRVVRALEIYLTTGVTKTGSDLASRMNPPEFDTHVIMLSPSDRGSLYARIEARVDKMVASGLYDEVTALCEKGLRETPTASQAIGYKEFYPVIDGVCGMDEAVAAVKLNTRRYAKRQLTWFSRMKKDEIIEV